jgi:hypothetical protein
MELLFFLAKWTFGYSTLASYSGRFEALISSRFLIGPFVRMDAAENTLYPTQGEKPDYEFWPGTIPLP